MNDYQGAVILVSHDPHLLELVCDRLWLVEGGTCKSYDGDLGDYRNKLLDDRRGGNGKSAPRESNVSRKEARKLRAQARAETAETRKKAKQAEAQMEKLEDQKTDLEARLADPDVYQGSTKKLHDLQVKLGEIKSSLRKTEASWMKAQEAIELADAG